MKMKLYVLTLILTLMALLTAVPAWALSDSAAVTVNATVNVHWWVLKLIPEAP
jgi:hypothetical protein